MNNLGGNTDNTHLGDTKVLGDLEVRDDLIIDGGITITPPDCLNVDCIKPSTLNGDVSIKNSNEDTIIKLSNDKSVEISGSYKLPTTAGTEGQLLTADAGGLTSSFKDQVVPLTPSQEIGYIAIANTSYNTSRTLIWSSLGGTNQFSTDVLGIGGYVEFKSIGKIYTRRTQDGIISDTYRLEVDVVQTGGYVDTSTFTWSISDNVFVLNKDVDYERDYEFRFTIQKMNNNSFTIFGSGTATQLVNPTGTIQLPVQKIQFQDVKDSDSQLLFTDVATDVKLNVYFTAVQDPGVISSFVPFSGQFHAHQLGFLPEVVVNTSDHSALSNLSLGDSHTQYSLSNGRFGGQTLTGGTSITDKLVLQSNASDPLDGHVELKSFIDMTTNQIINVSTAGGIGQLVDTNTTNNTGSVAVHSDVSSAGSGIIISSGERTAISTNTTNNTGSVAVHSDVSSAGSGIIISVAERTAIGTNTTALTGKVDKAGDTMTGELKMSSQIISGVANPVNAQDAATKSYVDTATDGVVIGPGSSVNSYLCSFNGTTGKLIKNSGISAIGGNIDQSSGAPLKLGGLTALSVDLGSTTIPTYVLGGLYMNSKKINNLLDPTAAQDGATKAYVDTATDGVVIGPASAVNSHLCSFDTTTGELIKDSGILQSDVVLKTGNNVMNGDLALLTAGNTELVITTTDPFNLARIRLSANGVLSSMRQSDSRLRIASNNNRIDLDSVVSEIALSTSGTPRLTISDTEVLSYLPVVTDQSFRQYRAVNPAQNGFPVLSGMYSMISSRVIGGTLTETSCFNDSGAVGTRTNPANTLSVGDTYHLHMSGLVETDGKGHGMTFRLKLGATTLMTTNSDDWDAGGTPTFWELEVDFVIRTIGSLGTMIGGGMITFSEDSWWKDAGSFSTTSDLTINTTISNTFDVTAQWDNNNANNVLTTQVATITRRF